MALALILIVVILCTSTNSFVMKPVTSSRSKASTNILKARAIYSFTDARRIARNYQFDSRDEFMDYSCPGAYQLPKNPEIVWADDWKSWDDWLGIRLDFPTGREIARSLGMNTKQEYMDLISSKTIDDNEDASRLPYQPDKIYKEEWQGWDDWLRVDKR